MRCWVSDPCLMVFFNRGVLLEYLGNFGHGPAFGGLPWPGGRPISGSP